MNQKYRTTLAAALMILAGGSFAFASSGTWTGASSALWQLNGNWTAAFPVTANTATFNGAGNGNTTIDLGTGTIVGSITFDTALAAAYKIGSGGAGAQTLQLSNNGVVSLTSSVGNSQIIDAHITMTGSTSNANTFTNNSTTNTLTVNGDITNGIVSGARTLNVNGAGDTIFNGKIDNGVGGNITFNKSGAGTLTLGGSTSNTRGIAVTDGKLMLNKSGTANAVGGTLTIVNSTVQYNSSAGSDQILNTAGVTLGNGAGTATLNLNGVSDTIGALTFYGSNSTATSQATITTGTGTLTFNGTITVTSNANLTNGATISGKVDTAASGTRLFAVNDISGAAVDLNISAAVSSTGGGLQKSGLGVMRLSNTANTYTGVTRLNNGVLEVVTLANGGQDSSLGKSSNAAANLIIGNGATEVGTLRYIGSANVTTDRGFSFSSNAAGTAAIIESSGTGTLSFDNTVAIAYGTTSQARTLTLDGTNTGANVFGKVLANNTANTTLKKEGVGTWVLDQTNTYGGGTQVNGGTLVFRNTGSKATSGTHTFAAGTTIGLGVATSGSYFSDTDVTNAFAGTMAGNLSNVTVNTTTNVGIDTTQGDFTYNTTIANSPTRGLTKLGTNTLILGGNNTYTGATIVRQGTLAVSSGGAINNTSGVTIESGATFRYNSSTALAQPITNNGGTIGGSGKIGVAVTLDSTSDVLAPGNSPGIQEYTIAQTWNSFTYNWEINDFNGSTTGSHYDQIQINNGVSGNLTLNNTTGSYVLNLFSLAGVLNSLGDVANFSETTKSWNILTTSGGISGFNKDLWTINTAGFTTNLPGPEFGGEWSLSATSNNLVLTYTAIPEPNVAALLGGMSLLILLRRRR